MPPTPLGKFRLVALIEGVSFLLIFGVGMPLKYQADLKWPNYIIGSAHGVLFILYCLLLLWAARSRRWPLSRIALAFLVSLAPFGTFLFDPSLRRELAEEAATAQG